MSTMKKIKTYTEMSQLKTFEDRFRYLKLNGGVGQDTFGFDRYMNQQFYKSKEWRTMPIFPSFAISLSTIQAE